MTFLALILKNLVRQKTRAGLTMLGIGIGITTVVALGVITGGLKTSSGEIIRTGDADFMVAQEGAADLSFSSVSEEQWSAVAATPGVDKAIGALFHITQTDDNPYFVILGVRPEDMESLGLTLTAGTYPSADAPDAILLGADGALSLGAAVGGTVSIDNHVFTVSGIYNAPSMWQQSGAFASLATVQQLSRKPGVVTAVFVRAAQGADITDLRGRIEAAEPQLVTIGEIGELSKVDQGIELLDAANLAISVLAVGIGAVGVMNTMVMSVFERTREIGIFRAVGWSSRRILKMVIGESLLLCVAAGIVGSLVGVLASRAVLLIPTVRSLMQPQYTVDIFIRAFVVAVIVALAGAAYPAWRAVRMSPMEALRHE